jgi:hypothetical protein
LLFHHCSPLSFCAVVDLPVAAVRCLTHRRLQL